MSGKNQKYTNPVKKANNLATIGKAMNKPSVNGKIDSPSGLKYALLGSILVITFCCYHYSLGNQFTNWDDNRFITDNIFIKSFSPANLKMILFHDVTGDYYNPVTILSYAINYHFSGMAPQAYYLTNISIHILNSFLLFFFVLMLLTEMEKQGYDSFKWKQWMAFFCTLVYAIHPMHVESVAWLAERKDVLYCFFYFAGMIAYIKYITKSEELRTKNYKHSIFFIRSSYLLVLSSYLLSLFSKPMAVVFPFSLLAIDVLLKQDKVKSLKELILEKLPFILVLIISIITTYHSEKLSGASQSDSMFTLFQRFLFATYSFHMYILRAFLPIAQSSFYPYPDPAGSLPFIFYISPFIALLIVTIPLYFSYRSGENKFRVVLFGLLFYFFNMAMVSKIIASGAYLLADRYSYVCYFGIFFPVTYFVYDFFQKNKQTVIKYGLLAISAYMLFFAVLTYQRTFVWHNSESLWTNVVEQYPHRVLEAYNNLGNYYCNNGNMDKAYANYTEAINLKSNDPKVYGNMGILMCMKGRYDIALGYYTTSLKIDSNNAITYAGRASVYFRIGRYDLAVKDYKHSLSMKPYNEMLLQNTALTFLHAQQYDSAISYYTKAIQINPANPSYFHHRGLAELSKGSIKPAMDDFTQNLQLAPHDSECMFYISTAYNSVNDFNMAYKYAQMAQNAQYSIPPDYIQLVKTHLKNGK